jgi:hypothetical protein
VWKKEKQRRKMMKFCKNVVFVIMIACVHGAQGMDRVELLDKDYSQLSLYQREERIKKELTRALCCCLSCDTALQNELADVQLKREEHERELLSVEDASPYIKCEDGLFAVRLQNHGSQKLPNWQALSGHVLSNLGIIDISNNKIKHLPLGSLLEYCSHVQTIDARDNEIEDITYRSDTSPYGITVGYSLRNLLLARNKLTTFDVDALYIACPNVRYLDISKNPLNSLACENTNAWLSESSVCSFAPFMCRVPVKPKIYVPADLDKKHVSSLQNWYMQKTLAFRRAKITETVGHVVGTPLMVGGVVLATQVPLFGQILAVVTSGLAAPLVVGGIGYLGAYCHVPQNLMEKIRKEAEANVRTHRSDV